MNRHVIIWAFLIGAVIIMANTASALLILSNEEFAQGVMMKDTTIDYTSYREIVVNEPGVIYLIKITNTGKDNKTYELTPDASVIRSMGTYRIDPSDTLTLGPDEEGTAYFYLAIEKRVSGRTEIPINIKSGSTETTIALVARPVGPFMPEKQKTGMLTQAFKAVLSIVLAIIIIIALIFGLRRIRKKNMEEDEGKKPEQADDVETYY
jgi:hypothetical protein